MPKGAMKMKREMKGAKGYKSHGALKGSHKTKSHGALKKGAKKGY